MELALLIVLTIVGGGVVIARAPKSRRVIAAVVLFGLLAASGWWRLGVRTVRAAPSPDQPRAGATVGYVTSAACLPCHPGEHASFSRTYHRTMTQLATPSSVLAPMGERLTRRGDQVLADGQRIVLTTGSHREQAYWVEGARHGDLEIAPFVWAVHERRLLPREEAFLTPPGVPLPHVRWGSNCIACHVVAGEPRHDPSRDAFDLRTAELGIACEACHGPGAAHVERHRDPLARYMQHASKVPDSTIVHPKKVSPERSAALCGQCHAYAFPRDENGWWDTGYARSFRAGDALEPSRILLTGPAAPREPRLDVPLESIFWPDGSVRVGGREYNGMVMSACYERGIGDRKLTCTSCHSMHEGEPAGQIAPSRTGSRACAGCHEAEARDPARHSHHASPLGSECVGCHMPRTSYALFSAVRSHRIDSPTHVDAPPKQPNACNLCHLDKSRAWTAERLNEWYGGKRMVSSAIVVAGMEAGLAGDAGMRALVADALGRSGPASAPFRKALLGRMRADPYAVVRMITERSLRAIPDAVTAETLDPHLVESLLAARDDRVVMIAE